jgi:hypothetical protein
MSASETPPCPRCDTRQVTRGHFMRGAVYFRPAGLRFWTRHSPFLPLGAVGLRREQAFGCVACGLVWTEVAPAALQRLLTEAGTDATRRRFGPPSRS